MKTASASNTAMRASEGGPGRPAQTVPAHREAIGRPEQSPVVGLTSTLLADRRLSAQRWGAAWPDCDCRAAMSTSPTLRQLGLRVRCSPGPSPQCASDIAGVVDARPPEFCVVAGSWTTGRLHHDAGPTALHLGHGRAPLSQSQLIRRMGHSPVASRGATLGPGHVAGAREHVVEHAHGGGDQLQRDIVHPPMRRRWRKSGSATDARCGAC